MAKAKKEREQRGETSDTTDFSWKDSCTQIKTVVDVLREPILILDNNLRIIATNQPFRNAFSLREDETKGKYVYEIKNGQLGDKKLRKLLMDMVVNNSFFKGFKLKLELPRSGLREMLLSSRLIIPENSKKKSFPVMLLLALEDITEYMFMAKSFTEHMNNLQKQIQLLEREIIILKKVRYG